MTVGIPPKIVVIKPSYTNRGKALGPDGISCEIFKHGGPVLEAALLKLMNSIIISEGCLPGQFDLSEIALFHKKGSIHDCANYQPTRMLSHGYKLLMQVIYNRISGTLSCSLSDSQAAYQQGRGTIDQIQSVQQIVEKANEFN